MKEIRALTGLRGVAAVTVFLAHTRDTLQDRGINMPLPDMFVRLFLSSGRQVDTFFVLSGFILAMTYHKWFTTAVTGESYWKFLRRRFARIYPLHFFMLVLIIAFVLAARLTNANTANGLDRFDFSTLPAHFLLIHAWGFLDADGVWNPPSWSISIEAMAYLLFPGLMWLNARWGRAHRWATLALVIALGFELNGLVAWDTERFGGIARGLSEFALGCATFNLLGTRAAAWLKSTPGSWAAVGVLALGYAITPDIDYRVALVAAPLLLAFCGDNPPGRALSWQPIYFLGEISYSIYLGHFLFTSIAYRLISISWMKTGTLPMAIGFAVIVAFVLVLSTLSYYAIERPCRDLLRDRRKIVAVAA